MNQQKQKNTCFFSLSHSCQILHKILHIFSASPVEDKSFFGYSHCTYLQLEIQLSYAELIQNYPPDIYFAQRFNCFKGTHRAEQKLA